MVMMVVQWCGMNKQESKVLRPSRLIVDKCKW